MNKLRFLLSASLAAALPLGADSLEFTDNGKLDGTIKSLDSGHLVFEHPAAPAPLRIKNEALKSIVLNHKGSSQTGPVKLDLTDDSSLTGEILSFDGETLRFRSDAAGTLEIPKKHLARINYGTGSGSIFAGPTSLESWAVHPEGSWDFDKNRGILTATESQASLSRNIDYPDRYRISFTASWKSSPYAQIILGSNELTYRPNDAHYRVTLRNTGLTLDRHSTQSNRYIPMQSRVSLDRNAVRQTNEADIVIEVDNNDRLLRVFFNGEPAGEAQDIEPGGSPSGEGFYLKCFSKGMTFSNIRVDELSQSMNSEAAPADADQIVTKDDNRASGTLLSIDNSTTPPQAQFKASSVSTQPLKVSLSRISAITFAQAEEPEIPEDSPARVLFRSGASLPGTLKSLDSEGALIDSPILGSLKIRRSHISKITLTPQPAP